MMQQFMPQITSLKTFNWIANQRLMLHSKMNTTLNGIQSIVRCPYQMFVDTQGKRNKTVLRRSILSVDLQTFQHQRKTVRSITFRQRAFIGHLTHATQCFCLDIITYWTLNVI